MSSADHGESSSQSDAVRRPADPDAVLGPLVDGRAPEEAAQALAQLINRAAARLHTLARGEAAARKEQPDWPQWAQLQNAARALVLHASTCRDLAQRLGSSRRP